MDRPMSNEESYTDRRQLFKSIWDTAINMEAIDKAEPDIDLEPHKTKIIKTLRLDEVDRCIVGRRKKQRIKNLRTVCKKILDFCNRQEADDTMYQHMIMERLKSSQPIHAINAQEKKKRSKRSPAKRKIKATKSLFTSHVNFFSNESVDKSRNTMTALNMRPLIVSQKVVSPSKQSGEVYAPKLRHSVMNSKRNKRKTVTLSDSLPTETNFKVVRLPTRRIIK